jgi:ATP-binding cassette, subfamily B, multidrug efflux pump
LAIARAVIRRPAVYLFDDAMVRASLRQISADSTVIVVAQRISTVLQAERVVVIDGGRVVGSGTHESLLLDCPTYVEFVDSQSSGAGLGPSHDRARVASAYQ